MRSSILVLWAAGTRVSLSSMGNWCRPSCLPESSAAWSSAGCVGRIHPGEGIKKYKTKISYRLLSNSYRGGGTK